MRSKKLLRAKLAPKKTYSLLPVGLLLLCGLHVSQRVLAEDTVYEMTEDASDASSVASLVGLAGTTMVAGVVGYLNPLSTAAGLVAIAYTAFALEAKGTFESFRDSDTREEFSALREEATSLLAQDPNGAPERATPELQALIAEFLKTAHASENGAQKTMSPREALLVLSMVSPEEVAVLTEATSKETN
jgi:hypothetical protein